MLHANGTRITLDSDGDGGLCIMVPAEQVDEVIHLLHWRGLDATRTFETSDERDSEVIALGDDAEAAKVQRVLDSIPWKMRGD
jgi:hypothetical protein